MTVIVCGSRGWTDRVTIETRLRQLPSDTEVVHGGAAGADQLGGEVAAALGMPVVVVRPAWAKYGRAAGAIRNQQMLDLYRPDLVLAFWDGQSRGTQDMMRRCAKVGVRLEVVTA